MNPWSDELAPRRQSEVVARASRSAAESLSRMAQLPVEVVGAQVERLPRPRLPEALGVARGQEVVAAVIGVEGSGGARVSLILERADAFTLCALLLGATAPAELDAMARSALQEMGNLMGTAFLNVLAESLGGRLLPTPPQIFAGPLDQALGAAFGGSPEGPGTELWLMHTTFRVQGVAVAGALVMLL